MLAVYESDPYEGEREKIVNIERGFYGLLF